MLGADEEEVEVTVVAGAAGAAAFPLPGAAATGEGEEAAAGAPLGVVALDAGTLPPTAPSIMKGPANARSGEVPNSKASI